MYSNFIELTFFFKNVDLKTEKLTKNLRVGPLHTGNKSPEN